MPTPEITRAVPADREPVVGSLVLAFAKDPVLRTFFPDEDTYPQFAAAFFGHLFDKRVHKGTVWTIDHGASTALWDPPAIEGAAAENPGAEKPAAERPALSNPALSNPAVSSPAVSNNATDDDLAAHLPADALDRVRAYDRVVHAVLPDTPFWYLGVLGTRPDSAGRGWGRAVMAAGLRQAAAENLPALLETSNPVNVEIYQRAGWKLFRRISEPLPIWVMQH